ncbi:MULTISPECIES: GNAT family N-acetyltransferase [unclassified Streptomyces]|uniref:GNAT family N-acetyltransferase n=1 Tax=unclassified Streptomyces TaxID=2593676 RepID=UPI002E37F799|nr:MULTISPECIES: GNAT family N-acetyltransferase [unclassified Streptomyces]WUC66619.1 GNAT family N-acetyltransferase [Streptomyces sp. NBC_00539]
MTSEQSTEQHTEQSNAQAGEQITATGTWQVAPEPFTTTDATALRRAYYAEVAGRYWRRSVTEDEIDQGLRDDPADGLAPPTGRFVVGRYDGRPMSCGGIRLLDATTAELTRVYVDPRARGTGGGAALLRALEDAGRELGAERVRLDTRSDLVEARRLYARQGYVEIPAYNTGPYAEHWFEKPISATDVPEGA